MVGEWMVGLTLETEGRQLDRGGGGRHQSPRQDVLLQLQEQLVPGQGFTVICEF